MLILGILLIIIGLIGFSWMLFRIAENFLNEKGESEDEL